MKSKETLLILHVFNKAQIQISSVGEQLKHSVDVHPYIIEDLRIIDIMSQIDSLNTQLLSLAKLYRKRLETEYEM